MRFVDSDTKAYNIIGEIPGSDPKAGYVMAGAHFDSWVAGDGAVDNGAGSVVVIEAARILRTARRAAQAHHPLRLMGRGGAGAARQPGLYRPAYRHPADPGRHAGRRGHRALARGLPDRRPSPATASSRPISTWTMARANCAASMPRAMPARCRCCKDWMAPVRQHGRDRGGRRADRRHRPCVHAVGRRAGLPVRPGPARLRRGSTIRASTRSTI